MQVHHGILRVKTHLPPQGWAINVEPCWIDYNQPPASPQTEKGDQIRLSQVLDPLRLAVPSTCHRCQVCCCTGEGYPDLCAALTAEATVKQQAAGDESPAVACFFFADSVHNTHDGCANSFLLQDVICINTSILAFLWHVDSEQQ